MGSEFYCKLIPPQTIWTGLNIDYDTNFSEKSVESLLNLCLDKLVSNEFHVRHIYSRIPPMLHFLLLKKAFLQGRILSVMHLMNQYPCQSFDIPIPDSLTNWSVFLSISTNTYIVTKPIVSFIPAVIKAFFTNSNSRLRELDISQIFTPTGMMSDFLSIFKGSSSQMIAPNQTYTLKARFLAFFEADIKILRDIKRALLKNKYANMEVIGLHIFSLSKVDPLLELFQTMDKQELLHFSLEVSFIDVARFMPALQTFCNLQSLNLAYFQNGIVLNSKYSTLLAIALNSFIHLKQLSLRASCLSDLLRKLLKYNCLQIDTENNKSPIQCCVVHRGKLEYLDVSSCKLKYDDLLVLQEFSFASTLKYLNLGHNSVDVTRLADLIEKIGSSLVVLDIEKCLLPDVQLKHLFSKYEKLVKLKSLNMKEIRISVEDIEALFQVLEKMPALRHIALSSTDEFSHFSAQFEKLKWKNRLRVVFGDIKDNIHTGPYIPRT